ncbi:hypothetical protein NIES4102_20780 [Chondrocystis sp. NIES-4102]|nr:hypothetical protein NIES4102_20780 [Chondrocystis sp. NIES-4102]
MPKLNINDRQFSLIFNLTTRYLLILTLSLIGLPITSLQAQETTSSESTPKSTIKLNSIFSIEGGKKLMQEADQAVDNQQYDLAAQKLQSARQVFNQLSNFYLQLFNSFSGLDNAVAESHRKKALETGIERDQATYELALVHRAQEKPELSIPLLIQIITSQSPTSGLGKKAYEQLLDIGFVDAPISPTPPPSTPPTTPPPSTPPTTPPPNTPPTIPPGTPPIPTPPTTPPPTTPPTMP